MPRHLALRTSIDLPLEGDGLPSAFRMFKAGANETTKGVFIFDDEAAALVMAAAQAHSVDLMVDLEHLSLDQESRSYDPDARAWLSLEVRPGPELWAVNVRWTDDGARRLRAKTQRYISPAFAVDEDNRVIEIVNIALTAMPATHGTPALVAANRKPRMKTLKDRKNELAARLSLAKRKIATLADGEGESAPAGKFASVRAAAADAAAALAEIDAASGDVDAAMAAVEAAVSAIKAFEEAAAGLGGAPAPEAAPEPEAALEPEAMSDKPEDEEPKKMSARDRAELIALRAREARRVEDEKILRLAAEMQAHQDIDAEMVRRGFETPATVALLSGVSLEAKRARLKAFDAAPRAVLGRIAAPRGADVQGGKDFVTPFGTVTLTANQMAECERVGAKPETFALNKARQLKSSKG